MSSSRMKAGRPARRTASARQRRRVRGAELRSRARVRDRVFTSTLLNLVTGVLIGVPFAYLAAKSVATAGSVGAHPLVIVGAILGLIGSACALVFFGAGCSGLLAKARGRLPSRTVLVLGAIGALGTALLGGLYTLVSLLVPGGAGRDLLVGAALFGLPVTVAVMDILTIRAIGEARDLETER